MWPFCYRKFRPNSVQQIGCNITRTFAAEAQFETRPYKLHRLDTSPAENISISKDDAMKIFTQMTVIRKMEAVSDTLYKQKIIRGFCHLYSGQEACAVGVRTMLRPQDVVITAYRCHGWAYVMGLTPFEILTELTGREKGASRGKGGSMHIYAPNFFGGNGIVGAQVPLGTGAALANQYKGNGGISMSLYGDGAANQGQVFESFNMAQLFKLPVIFVCENNQYGMGTSTERSSCSTEYYTRGDVIPGIWIDGMDVVSVIAGTKFAIDFVQRCGPIVLEFFTYRFYGHSLSDPGTSYRSRDEIQEVRKNRDPIVLFKAKMIETGLANEEELKQIETKVGKEIKEIAEAAKTEKEIPIDELCADVYSNCLEPKIRGIYEMNLVHKKINKGINENGVEIKTTGSSETKAADKKAAAESSNAAKENKTEAVSEPKKDAKLMEVKNKEDKTTETEKSESNTISDIKSTKGDDGENKK